MSDQKTPHSTSETSNVTSEQAELADESLESVAGGQTNCFPDDPTEPNVFEIEMTPTIKPLL